MRFFDNYSAALFWNFNNFFIIHLSNQNDVVLNLGNKIDVVINMSSQKDAHCSE